MAETLSYACPVCKARFRGTDECSRCGADLRILTSIAMEALRARNAAREALTGGRVAEALELSHKAQSLHATDSGRRLLLLASWISPSCAVSIQ